MDIQKEWFTLDEAAKIIRPEVGGQPLSIQEAAKEVLDIVFKSDLIPSCLIEPVLCGLYTDILTPEAKARNEWAETFRFLPCQCIKSIRSITTKQYFFQKRSPFMNVVKMTAPASQWPNMSSERRRLGNPFNVRFTGLVDFYPNEHFRNNGKSSGMIEFHPNINKSPWPDNLIRLVYYAPSGIIAIIDLIEPREVAESSLVIRLKNLQAFISNNSAAMKRLEQFLASGNIDEPINAVVTEKQTIHEKVSFPVPLIPPATPNDILQIYTFNQVASFLKTTAEDVFDTINGYVLDPNTNKKTTLFDPCTGKTTLLYPSIVIDENNPVVVQYLKIFGKRKSGLPYFVLQDVLQHPLGIRKAKDEQNKIAQIYRHNIKNFVAKHETLSGVCLIGNRLDWNQNGWARVTSLTSQGQDRGGGAVVGPLSVHKNDLVISSFALDHYREETGIRVKFPHDVTKQTKSKQQKDNIGGAPKGPLAEAIEHVYLKYLKEGNTEILRKGRIKEFLERLKELADEKGNKNFSRYVADRIEKVKISPAGNTVITKEQIINTGNGRETKRESRTYPRQ